jgi:hexosaminidase
VIRLFSPRRRGRTAALLLSFVLLAPATGVPAAAAPAGAPTSAGAATDAVRPGSGDDVVPRPTSWTVAPGTTTLGKGAGITVEPAAAGRWTTGPTQPGLAERPTIRVARDLADELARVTGLRLSVTTASRSSAIHVALVDDPALGAEGYRLTAADGTIRIQAATSTGVYYAGRTLEQMLAAGDDHRTLRNGTVRDVPDQRMRMVMLDAGRKYWEPDYLEDLVRQMSWQKMNTLFLQFSDAEGFRLDSPAFPGLAEPAVSYDRDEIADLVKFAARHHVMLVPGIDVPGHATVLSDYFGIGFGTGPDACLPQHMHSHLTPDWVIDMTNPETSRVTRDLLTEFLPWFDAPYAHIGADELPGQLGNCSRVRATIEADPEVGSLGDLLTRYINDAAGVARDLGKRTIIYNGVEHMDSPHQDVDADVVFMTWEGTGSEPVIDGHDEIAVGPFYVTPNNYHRLYPDERWMYEEWAPSVADDMLGSGVMNWADYNFWADDAYFEGAMAAPRAILADRTWNASAPPDGLDGFRQRVATVGAAPGVEPAEPPARVDDGRPSHRWTFDDAPYPAGWTWAGSPGNTLFAEDVAGDLPGTSYIINNPTPVPGVVGQAWRFDHDRDGVGFGGGGGAPPRAGSAGGRRTAAGGHNTLLSARASALKVTQWNTCGQVGITAKGVADHAFDYATPLGEWVHLTLVARPGRTDLHVNGELVDTVGDAVSLPMRSVGDDGSSLRADLDELVTYDEALSADQVRAAYQAYGVPGSAAGGPC